MLGQAGVGQGDGAERLFLPGSLIRCRCSRTFAALGRFLKQGKKVFPSSSCLIVPVCDGHRGQSPWLSARLPQRCRATNAHRGELRLVLQITGEVVLLERIGREVEKLLVSGRFSAETEVQQFTVVRRHRAVGPVADIFPVRTAHP